MCSGDFGGRHLTEKCPHCRGYSHAEFSGAFSIHLAQSLSWAVMGRSVFSTHQVIKASRLSVRCCGRMFSSVRDPIHPKSWQKPRPVIDRQIYNAALPGPSIETWGRTRENQRREAEVRAAQRLIWSQPARSWRGESLRGGEEGGGERCGGWDGARVEC